MPRPKKATEEVKETATDTLPTREELAAQIAELKALIEKKQETAEVVPLKEVKAPVTNKPHVPAEYLDTVNTVLNNRFEVEIEYGYNTPTFGFSILVPKDYSNAGKPHWDMYHEDRRTRVISNAEGSQGVKQWVEKVYDNFDNETKARISSDRLSK